MRVLITGATGSIGTALRSALHERGDDVVGLSRDPERARQRDPLCEWHGWQPTLERPPQAAFEAVEGVVNLVGETIAQRWSEEAKARIMDSRRTATHNLAAAIAGLPERPRVLVSQSAVGYYGDGGDAVLDESAPSGSGFDSEVTRAWEAAAHEVEASGVRLAILRSGQVLDRSSGLLAQLLPPFRLGLGGPIAGGDQYLSWIHVADEVALLLWALDSPEAQGAFNATAPNPVTNREFAQALGRALNRPAVVPVPGFALDVRFGRELGQVLRGGQRVLPRRATEMGFRFAHPRLDEALADLL